MANQGPTEARLLCLDFDNTIVNGHCHKTLINAGFVPRITGKMQPDGRSDNAENGVQVQVNGQFTNTITGQVATGFSTNSKTGEQLNNQKIHEILSTKVGGFKHGPLMCRAIKEALKNGNKVAITSFTLYPEVLLPALQMLRTAPTPDKPNGEGLTQQELNQICIVGGFPQDGARSPECKQEHIKKAMQHFGIREPENVMLVDDSPDNITKAHNSGMKTRWVSDEPNPNSDYFNTINQFVGVGPLNLQAQRQPLAPQNPNVANQLQQQPYYQAAQVNGTHQKLQKESMAKWETRPNMPKENPIVSQFISSPLTEDAANQLIAKLNPSLKAAIANSNNNPGLVRVVIQASDAVKVQNTGQLFSNEFKKAQVVQPPPVVQPNTPVASSRPLTAQDIVKPKGPIPQPIQANQFQKLPEAPSKPEGLNRVGPVQSQPAEGLNRVGPVQSQPAQGLNRVGPVKSQPAEGLNRVGPVQSQPAQGLNRVGPVQSQPAEGLNRVGPVQSQPAEGLNRVGPVQSQPAQGLNRVGPVQSQPAEGLNRVGPVQSQPAQGLNRVGPVQSQPAPQAQQANPPKPPTQLPPPPDPSKFSTVQPTTQLPPPPTFMERQVRIPEPITPNQVAKHLPPSNPALDAILDHSLAEITKMYTDAKHKAHKDENVFVSLFNKAKSTANSFTGTTKEREQQIKQIVDVLKAIKNDQTSTPLDKAATAFAYLDGVRNESNSRGLKGACIKLQMEIVKTESDALGKSPQYKQQADFFANSTQTEVKNNNKPK